MYRKFGAVTIGAASLESIVSLRVRGANNLSPDDFTDTKGYNKCVTRGRRERTIEIETKDVTTVMGIDFCGADLAVSAALVGECEDAGSTLTIAAATCRGANPRINKSANGEAKTATILLVARSSDGTTEPVTFTEA